MTAEVALHRQEIPLNNDHPTLVFFHIGKTGGTSLSRYFEALSTNSYLQPNPDELSALAARGRDNRFDFISGHYHVEPWLRRLPSAWRSLLVLRSPVQHLLSSYWHVRTHEAVAAGSPLQDLIEAAKRFDLMTLLETRAGRRFAENFDNPQARFILGKPFGPLTDADAARAAERLASITYVGTTERLDRLAAHVAASLPWAVGWETRPLPRVMVNPLNNIATEELPRPLLRRILAFTEFDADLHQQALRLQTERCTAGRLPHPGPAAAASSSGARPIPVADLVRVCPTELHHARAGHELVIADDTLRLHPPQPAEGFASVVVAGVALDGQCEIVGRLTLAHTEAAPVRFAIMLHCSAISCVDAWFLVAPGEPLDISVRFRPVTGQAQLTLRTEMAAGAPNSYAWATFEGLTIR